MIKRLYFIGTAIFLSVALGSGCAWVNRKQDSKEVQASPSSVEKTPKQKPSPSKAVPKPVDAEAQQRYYDRGLKFYTEENYEEAKKAWQKVLQLGANTPLADKARSYLKKTEQSLKTLQEYEKK